METIFLLDIKNFKYFLIHSEYPVAVWKGKSCVKKTKFKNAAFSENFKIRFAIE